MRSQAKPFTVEIRKSRKPPTEHQSGWGLVNVQSAAVDPTERSPIMAAADRAFRAIDRQADLSLSENDAGQGEGELLAGPKMSDEVASNGLGPVLTANRILPDLTRGNDTKEAKEDERLVASRWRRARRPTKEQSQVGEIRWSPKMKSKRLPKRVTAGLNPAGEREPDDIAPVDPTGPTACHDPGFASDVNGQEPAPRKLRQKPSAREIRRAINRGDRISSRGGLDRKPNRRRAGRGTS